MLHSMEVLHTVLDLSILYSSTGVSIVSSTFLEGGL